MVGDHGNHAGTCFRLTHIHPGLRNLSVFDRQLNFLSAGQGFNGNRVLICQAMVVHIFRHAADPVTAHLAFRAVRIEHAHFKIRCFRGTNQNQPVASDTVMIPANIFSHRLRIGHFLLRAVCVNIIVSAAVHFGKLEFHCFLLLLLFPCLRLFAYYSILVSYCIIISQPAIKNNMVFLSALNDSCSFQTYTKTNAHIRFSFFCLYQYRFFRCLIDPKSF